MRILIYILFFILTAYSSYATHNRAGEITFEHLYDYTYKITVTTFTYTLSPADRPQLEVSWGDGTTSVIPRVDTVSLPDYYRKNVYEGTHSFPGSDVYHIVMQDPNRNYGIDNIPGSVQVPFTIKTSLKIDAENGFSSSPVLTYDPIDWAAVGQLFIHNPGAWDPDDDSLSYKLTECLGDNGQIVPGYSFPAASNDLYVDPVSGDFVWDTPVDTGRYNVAMLIEEWRDGVKIGRIIRDMQIEVIDSDNEPPNIQVDDYYCVTAGDTITFTATATDTEDYISLSATGAPIVVVQDPAVFPTVSGPSPQSSQFYWDTKCHHIRKQPYQVIIRASDNNSEVNLTNLKTVEIEVVAPAPVIDTLIPTNNSVELFWHPEECFNHSKYDIYRKNAYYGFVPDDCETGVPAYTGYQKIATVDSNITSYLDNNGGMGLVQGYNYCYMVVARYSSDAESYASEEKCTELVKGIPVITNVSIDSTDANDGKVYLAWSKPNEFDTVLAPGPYKYLIYRSYDLWGNDLQLIDSLPDINDTIYYDTPVNTLDSSLSYMVEFYNDEPGNRFLIGPAMVASQVRLEIDGADNKLILNFNKNVPWINDKYVVYRQNNTTLNFDSIGVAYTETFTDSNLANGKEYCYKVKSIGGYVTDGFIDPIINFSQINCGEPIDTIPTCPPTLTVEGDCDEYSNYLNWTNPNNTCADDAIAYKIYYKPTLDDDFELIQTIHNVDDTAFQHTPDLTMAGCYTVTAIDSFQNESAFSEKVCIDECTYYELPNVFTPNGDNMNEIYRPGPYRFVKKVDMKIYNRWGNLIFETTDPDINWDGRYMENNKLVSDGVYYYICDVYEYRLAGLIPRTLTGFIHVFQKDHKDAEDED